MVQLNPGVVGTGEPICTSSSLRDGGAGVRFALRHQDRVEPAFVVRHRGVARAFLNRCAHKLVELDWEPGQFFDTEQRFLICASHGALYDPASGACMAGPCRGGRLVPVPVEEAGGVVRLAAPARL